MPRRDREGESHRPRIFWLASSSGQGRPPGRRILQAPSSERLEETRAQARRVSQRVLESLAAGRPRVRPLVARGEPRPEGGAPRSGWLIGRTILIVEDHADSREVLRMVLESCGATVLLAADGEEALARVRERRPDLVLCDLRMPGMDGFTFVARLRANPRLGHVRVVAVTALGTDEDIERTWRAGFDGHLVKPVDLERLTTLLERVFWAQPRPR